MKINVTRKLNNQANATFEIDEKDTDLAMLMMAFFAEESKCWIKGFEDYPIKWDVRKAGENGEYTYIEMVCFSPDHKRMAKRQAGKYKQGGMFWKKWIEYHKGTDGKFVEVADNTLTSAGTKVPDFSEVDTNKDIAFD